jgi:hypothetical protein
MHPREATGTPKAPSPIFGSGSVVFVEWSVGVASKMKNTPSVRIQKISAGSCGKNLIFVIFSNLL